MGRHPFDPYIRDFACTAEPARSPFRRSGFGDAGLRFIYLTNRKARWSLLLDPEKGDIIAEAHERILTGYTQLWLLEKVYSAPKPRKNAQRSVSPEHVFPSEYPQSIKRAEWKDKLYVLLREPYRYATRSKEVVAYYVDKEEAIEGAKLYSMIYSCKAIIGVMRGDLQWH